MAAALLHPRAPLLQPSEVLARIEVVRAKLRHVERDHLEPIEVERDVADIAFGEILLHVGED